MQPFIMSKSVVVQGRTAVAVTHEPMPITAGSPSTAAARLNPQSSQNFDPPPSLSHKRSGGLDAAESSSPQRHLTTHTRRAGSSSSGDMASYGNGNGTISNKFAYVLNGKYFNSRGMQLGMVGSNDGTEEMIRFTYIVVDCGNAANATRCVYVNMFDLSLKILWYLKGPCSQSSAH